MKKTELSRHGKSDLPARSKSSGSEIDAFLKRANSLRQCRMPHEGG